MSKELETKASEARGVRKRDLADDEVGERGSSKIMQSLRNQGKDLILGAMGECYTDSMCSRDHDLI